MSGHAPGHGQMREAPIEAFSDIWAPNVLVVDTDADGQFDIAVATH